MFLITLPLPEYLMESLGELWEVESPRKNLHDNSIAHGSIHLAFTGTYQWVRVPFISGMLGCSIQSDSEYSMHTVSYIHLC